MSADNDAINTHAPYSVVLTAELPEAERSVSQSLLALLPAACIANVVDDRANDSQTKDGHDTNPSSIGIKRMVDGRGMACPMPLLKTKVALRDVAAHESLYVVATDPNSQADITAFCQQSQQASHGDTLILTVNQKTAGPAEEGLSKPSSDTIFHFIITKTDSN